MSCESAQIKCTEISKCEEESLERKNDLEPLFRTITETPENKLSAKLWTQVCGLDDVYGGSSGEAGEARAGLRGWADVGNAHMGHWACSAQ